MCSHDDEVDGIFLRKFQDFIRNRAFEERALVLNSMSGGMTAAILHKLRELLLSVGTVITVKVAAAGIVIATASNNVVKRCYAYAIGGRKTGRQSFWLLTGLATLGLVPLIWLIG